MPPHILIKPDDIQKGSVYHFSDQIINALRKDEELFVIGMGNAISMACMAVQRSSTLARVFVSELSLDFIGSPLLGIGGAFFVLNKKSTRDWDAEKKKLEEGMNLSFERNGQLIVVSKTLLPERAIPLALSRLVESDLLKISAAGIAINRAALIALELTKGDIARDKLGIRLITISTVRHVVKETSFPETVMELYIQKNIQTSYSKKHEQMLKMLTSG